MAIIVSNGGLNAQKIDQTHFGLENHLQEYVKNNPDIVPIYEIQEDARLLVLAREYMTNSGPIDALGVDQEGNVYVIETKLYKNADKRTVLAQALDYGASLWKHSGDADMFIANLDQRVQAQFGISLLEKVADFFDLEDPQEIIQKISKNLIQGNIKFVILMDSVDDRLKDLVTYVNQNSKFDVYAVDLEYYKHDQFEIIIPKLYGAEVHKTITSSDDSNRFDNQKIIEWIDRLHPGYLTIDAGKTTKSFIRFTTDVLDEIIPHRDEQNGGWGNGNAYYYEIKSDRTGWMKLNLVFNSTNIIQNQIDGQNHIMQFLRVKVKKPDWIWFNVAGWKIDYEGAEKNIEDSITNIITKQIPDFEEQLLESWRSNE